MPFIASTTFDLAQVGYSEAEYFISGTATAYTNVGPLSNDGQWTVTPGDTAAYKTRILVYRPIDPEKFNGTVVVEWLNVSGGLDAAPDWISAHTELIREGCAWVGVSAQYVGVEGGNSILGLPVTPLKTTDPERYGSLVHPGDSFSYDIFSQSAQAIRRPAGISPLGDLKISAVIAAGESQSAFRMVTYINAIHPLADIYDGFLVHSRGGNGHRRRPTIRTPAAGDHGARRGTDPQRPQCPGADLRDRNGPHLSLVLLRSPSGQRPLSPLGGGRHRARRRLHARGREHGSRRLTRCGNARS